MMGSYSILLILSCLIYVEVTANTRLCRKCNHLVKGPAECSMIHHCPEFCITERYLVNGENLLRYDCAHANECDPKHQHHVSGQLMCRQCCDDALCQRHSCHATTAPSVSTTPAGHVHTKFCRSCNHPVRGPNDCRTYKHCHQPCITEVYVVHGEFRFRYDCAHAGECNTNTSHQLVAHHGHPVCKQCSDSRDNQKYSCSQYLATTLAPTANPNPTSKTITSKITTTSPAPTTTGSPALNVTATTIFNTMVTQPCLDHDDVTFTCQDMIHYGYCDPNAGAGYALA